MEVRQLFVEYVDRPDTNREKLIYNWVLWIPEIFQQYFDSQVEACKNMTVTEFLFSLNDSSGCLVAVGIDKQMYLLFLLLSAFLSPCIVFIRI